MIWHLPGSEAEKSTIIGVLRNAGNSGSTYLSEQQPNLPASAEASSFPPRKQHTRGSLGSDKEMPARDSSDHGSQSQPSYSNVDQSSSYFTSPTAFESPQQQPSNQPFAQPYMLTEYLRYSTDTYLHTVERFIFETLLDLFGFCSLWGVERVSEVILSHMASS